ncbi:MAG: 2-phospho-L-lactate transferase CofD family protein, partial [Methanobacterium paludis]|nr:2-phospho-L-lactate transferase CofD family protein [Methanobacterium paludis]
KTWYGIDNDTFITHETLKEINCPETLKIGDRDRATKIQKTMLMEQYPLSKVVNIQRKSLGVESHVIPMSDEESHLKIKTDEGDMEFHKFLIERRGEPEVLDLEYNSVKPAHGVIESIEEADLVVIGPSNPVTSIGPIISMEGVSDALKKSYVTAVSPIIGGTPVSGPAAKFMRALGHEVSCRGVAAMYQEFLDKFIVDTEDRVYKKEIEKLISDVVVTNTNMKNIGDKMMLARSILGEIL